jgi:ergothioneine biosynthesis protein EgtB
VRAATEDLCRPLSAEDCIPQSMPEASPVQWHLAHTSWFFETFVLAAARPGFQPFHPRFNHLFNSYYNAIGERVARDQRGRMTRPSLAEIRSYRAFVDREVGQLLRGELSSEIARVVELGLHHEQQHQELILTDVKHLLSLNPLRPAYHQARRPAGRSTSAPLRFLGYPRAIRWIGHAGEGFAFDNEEPRHEELVHAFQLASRPSTNGEFLRFMADGGYRRPEFWLSDGWDAVQREGWRAPLYWEELDGRWRQYTLGGVLDVDPAGPVCHVSYYEADAFARWSGARLPRESEWESAANDTGPGADGHFADSGEYHPRPSAEEARGPSAMFGDVWEWTQSAYSAYPGYRSAPGALGEYNGKFMCNQLVLRGGSCASPAGHVRASYRNFFAPHARWQFSGVRLARDGS